MTSCCSSSTNQNNASLFIHVSSKNETTAAVASNRLPVPINLLENEYEFALLNCQLNRNWANLTNARLVWAKDDETRESDPTVPLISSIDVPSNYYDDKKEFTKFLNELVKQTKKLYINFAFNSNTQVMTLKVDPQVTVWMTPNLQTLFGAKMFRNDSDTEKETFILPCNFEDYFGRILVLSDLAPMSYINNTTLPIIRSIITPTGATPDVNEVISDEASSPIYYPCIRTALSKVEIRFCDEEGRALPMLRSGRSYGLLHFRRISKH